jgi:hypothetical protein
MTFFAPSRIQLAIIIAMIGASALAWLPVLDGLLNPTPSGTWTDLSSGKVTRAYEPLSRSILLDALESEIKIVTVGGIALVLTRPWYGS